MIDATKSKIAVPTGMIEAVLSQEKVDDPPHSFYKYPARFSPLFAREAIKAFTKPGETVVDPFCGGGTSLVEAMSLGRKAAGFDISSLDVAASPALSGFDELLAPESSPTPDAGIAIPSYSGSGDSASVAAVPEPGSLIALLSGTAALCGLQRFRRRARR